MSRPPRARAPLKGAALELFVRHGVHATGIREIARHARCSEAALYRHWPSKEALIVSLFEEHLGEVVTILDEAVGTVGDISHRVRVATAAVLRLYDDQPLVFRFVLLVRYEIATSLPADRRSPAPLRRPAPGVPLRPAGALRNRHQPTRRPPDAPGRPRRIDAGA